MPNSILLEIGLEELPARFVEQAIEQLQQKTEKWLHEVRVAYTEVRTFATPRRLAVLVSGVADRQLDVREEVKGPARKIALDGAGNWSQAALGFARSQGVHVEQLFFQTLNGIEYVYAIKESGGGQTAELLATGLKTLVESLTFAKNMRWADYELRYARPLRWLVALYGAEVIPFEIAGIVSGRTTYGHRFLGGEVHLAEATQYENALRAEFVIADLHERRAEIVRQIEQLAGEKQWAVPIQEDLLAEVTSLVEYPTILFGSFSAEFLHIPQDVLITSMREHQRYFPVLNHEGKLEPYFITVRNGDNRSLAQVAKGNEKVIRARLSDARFFYLEDQKMTIEFALAKLEKIVYQEELGTIADKVRRITANASKLCEQLDLAASEQTLVRRAAHLCKFDLVTQMVYEFPELQGAMGEDYARKLGEPERVAVAVREHYKPRFSGDSVPADRIGAIISVADKIDTLVGCFSLGLIPTGSQDPYALRRQTAGIVQILAEYDWPLKLSQLMNIGCDAYRAAGLLKRSEEELQPQLQDFFALRIKNALAERNIRYDVVDAVMAVGTDQVSEVLARGAALMEAVQAPTFKTVAEALSRAVNIAVKNPLADARVVETLFEDECEASLQRALHTASHQFALALQAGDTTGALVALRTLTEPVTLFFERVMVMAENAAVRQNRLSLMHEVAALVRRFADLSKIVWGSAQ